MTPAASGGVLGISHRWFNVPWRTSITSSSTTAGAMPVTSGGWNTPSKVPLLSGSFDYFVLIWAGSVLRLTFPPPCYETISTTTIMSWKSAVFRLGPTLWNNFFTFQLLGKKQIPAKKNPLWSEFKKSSNTSLFFAIFNKKCISLMGGAVMGRDKPLMDGLSLGKTLNHTLTLVVLGWRYVLL